MRLLRTRLPAVELSWSSSSRGVAILSNSPTCFPKQELMPSGRRAIG
jgi:hypothetical protein